MFKTILASCAAAAFAFGATVATAAPLTFDFTIDLISAPDGSGSFTIDGAELTGSGLEIFAPNSVSNTLFSFTAMVGGLTYTETDDPSFDAFPEVGFLDGIVTSISYAAEIGNTCLSIGAGSGLGLFFGDLSGSPLECAEPGFRSGEITNIAADTGSPVPAPATGLLLAAGIGVLGLWRRRRAWRSRAGFTFARPFQGFGGGLGAAA